MDKKYKKMFIKQLINSRGIDNYNSMDDANEDWDALDELDQAPLEDLIILATNELDDYTQIIKVNNKYYYWFSIDL